MESPAISSPGTPASPSTASEQARLRRERREAKIKAGGSARLGKITSMGGRPPESIFPSTPVPAPQAQSTPSSSALLGSSPDSQAGESMASDPAEVDISHHGFFTPPPKDAASYGQKQNGGSPAPQSQQQAHQISEEQMRRMMLGLDGPIPQQQHRQQQTEGSEAQDPMLQLLQQMMGGGGDNSSGAPGGGGLPPGLVQLMGQGQNQGQSPAQDTQRQQANRSAQVWRIIHALSALMLGIYVVLTTSFNGLKSQRLVAGSQAFDTIKASLDSGSDNGAGVVLGGRQQATNFFWMFATVELLLQSTRFFLDRGQLQGSAGAGGGGLLVNMADTFLPEPYRGYFRLARRYGVIISTVIGDAMVIVFVLGCVAWWKGI